MAARRVARGPLRQCRAYPLDGGFVCNKHGGTASQVSAKAEVRTTLAERIARTPKRHPLEILDDTTHATDVLVQHVQEALAADASADQVDTWLQLVKTSAAMAKLSLDAGGGARWEEREVNRRFGEVLAELCRDFARRLGHDPSSQLVADAFADALEQQVRGKRRVKAKAAKVLPQVKAIEAEVVDQ